ncbi:hypothetical protein ACJIZ3_024134 [Penstemon smallii]|uniref:Secreted protein n=1 Tax=Penstemon smallii TaxID=265156 RepID=A0ABD3TSZ6_9LAMI
MAKKVSFSTSFQLVFLRCLAQSTSISRKVLTDDQKDNKHIRVHRYYDQPLKTKSCAGISFFYS